MKRLQHTALAIGLFLLLLAACKTKTDGHNTLTAQEQKDGWILLFDGKTTNGWHLYNKGNTPSAWVVDSGALVCRRNTGRDNFEHGDFVTDRDFENFELHFDWKISQAGNSGVFVNVVELPGVNTAWSTGPEYQLLENSNPDFVKPEKRAGCLFGFGAPLHDAPVKPYTDWNQSVIKQQNGKVAFYLNGILTASRDFKAADWPAAISQTGFKHFPEYGKYTRGKIGLQDWAKGIAFRNIKIKEL
ncbi:MAG: DUF1080 domain-containing protein [Bacteroidetes bacterium]|nr:DUF1080 domain-containing protein [Bacteroidota bacterium]